MQNVQKKVERPEIGRSRWNYLGLADKRPFLVRKTGSIIRTLASFGTMRYNRFYQ
jgi:hypothetical protein